MEIIQTPLEGFLVIEPDLYEDDRGFFLETYREQRYNQAGITDKFVQEISKIAIAIYLCSL